MLDFKETTILKGLEKLIPENTENEIEKIFSIIGYTIKNYTFDKKNNYNRFYKLLNKNFKNNISFDKDMADYGKKIYSEVQRRMKDYSFPLIKDLELIKQKQKSEIKIISRIKGE